MSFYESLAATAARLITKFGADATLKRVTEGAYDPATGSASVTETSTTIRATIFDVEQKDIDGILVLTGDKKAYIASSVSPIPNDKISWFGIDYIVASVKEIAPAGVAVMYEAIIRR